MCKNAFRRLSSPAGWHLHVWWEAGGEVGQRDGWAVGLQHPCTQLVAAETVSASSLRPGGAHRPCGGAARWRRRHADLLWLLARLQLHQQSSGVQHQWVDLLTLPFLCVCLIAFYWQQSNTGDSGIDPRTWIFTHLFNAHLLHFHSYVFFYFLLISNFV